MNRAFVGVLLLGAAPFAAGCGGATSVDDPSPPPAVSTGAGSGTQAQACTPVSLVATPGQMVTSLVVVDHQLYWTALETDGTGSVSTASACEGGASFVRLARGLGPPSSLVVDGTVASWIEQQSSVHAMATSGGAVTTVAEYATGVSGSTVEYLASYSGRLYWVGIHAACTSSTECAGLIPYVAAGAIGSAPVELYTGVQTNSWSNLLVDARGVAVIQEGAMPPASPDEILLRVPLDGAPAVTLDTQVPTTFQGSALAACGQDVCWFGADFGSPQAMAFVRVPDGASAMHTTLPAAVRPEQDIFLTMDADRVYYLEGNFDTYGPAQVSLRSMSTSGQDVRTLAVPQSSAGTAAIAFDAQSVYVAAADGIHVLAK
jgi:hypothetical protein